MIGTQPGCVTSILLKNVSDNLPVPQWWRNGQHCDSHAI